MKNKQWLQVAVLVTICVVVYGNSLFNGFVYDDIGTIVENEHIADFWTNLPAFFTSSYFKIAGIEASYRPIATFSYYVLYAIFGLNPVGYHLFSLLVHILNVIMVYLLMNRLQKNKVTSLFAGLLFACHPALTEAVNCISYNEDLLAAFFFLAALLFYIRADDAGQRAGVKYYPLSLFFFLSGLLSKEMAIALPAVILVYDFFLKAAQDGKMSAGPAMGIFKERFFYYCGYLAIGIFYLALRFFILAGPRQFFSYSYGSLIERIIYLPYHLFGFVKIALFPTDLNADYVFSYPENFFQPANMLSLLLIAALGVLSFFLFKKSRLLPFGIFWFFIMLFPVSNLIQIANPVADRYLYLPLVGFCIVVATVLTGDGRLLRMKNRRLEPIKWLIVILILLVYASLSMTRNRDWKDNLALWTKTVQSSPGSFVAHGSLGRVFQERGRLDEAIAEYEKAIEINPADAKAYYNLGTIFEKQARVKDAIAQYQKSIDANPDFRDAHFNLANIYAQNGLLAEAIPLYQNVIRLDPEDLEARNNLGVVYARQGKLEEAVAEWEKLLKLDPANASARGNIEKARSLN